VLYILYVRTTCILYILHITLYDLLCDLNYYSSSHSLIGSIMIHAISTNSSSFTLSSCDICLIRSVTLAPSSLSLSLKTFIISRLSIKGTVLPSSFTFICAKWLIILKHPLLLQTQQRAKTVAFILLSSEVILLYSCCSKEGLVYVAIAAPSSRQPSSCFKCTSINMQLSCNIHSVSDAKCIFYIYLCFCSAHSDNKNTWYYTGLLALLCTLWSL